MTTAKANKNKSRPFAIASLLGPQKLQGIILPIIATFVLLVIWQLLCPEGSKGLPGPIQVVKDTWDPYIVNPFFNNGGVDIGLALHTLESLKRVFTGFLLSAVVGIILGILIGSNKLLYKAIDPIFQVLRTIPPLAWLPIALVVMKQSQPAAIFVIFVTAIWPILINTTVGVQQIPQDYINVRRVLKLSSNTYFFKILLPSALPYIFTGLRIAIGLSWLAIVAAEMLVGGPGIGFFVWDAYNSSAMSQIIIGLVYVGVAGLILDRLVGFIGSKIVAEDPK
jgi:nitrate/nitrite transport system permease protein